MSNMTFRRRVSSVLQSIDEVTSRVGSAAGVALLLLAFITALAVLGFPTSWQLGFATVSNAVVLVMLFVLKHTQSRQQTALQLKLDELIRSIPAADDHLVHIERAEERELVSRERDKIEMHESLRRDDDSVEVRLES